MYLFKTSSLRARLTMIAEKFVGSTFKGTSYDFVKMVYKSIYPDSENRLSDMDFETVKDKGKFANPGDLVIIIHKLNKNSKGKKYQFGIWIGAGQYVTVDEQLNLVVVYSLSNDLNYKIVGV